MQIKIVIAILLTIPRYQPLRGGGWSVWMIVWACTLSKKNGVKNNNYPSPHKGAISSRLPFIRRFPLYCRASTHCVKRRGRATSPAL